MSHYLTIEDTGDELRLALVCTATPDAPCRKRPSTDRESWHDDDDDLTSGHECWAVEYASEGGWETVVGAVGAQWPRIPVTVAYVEGVELAPVAPHPVIEWAHS